MITAVPKNGYAMGNPNCRKWKKHIGYKTTIYQKLYKKACQKQSIFGTWRFENYELWVMSQE